MASCIRLRAALLLFSLAGVGCVTAEGVTRRAVPAALDSSVDYLNDPDAQKKIQRLLEDPQIKEASRELTAALVEGALDGATDEERQAKLRGITSQFIDSVAQAAARNLREDISPAMSQAAASAVQRVLSTALSPRSREQAAAMVDSVTRSAVTAMTESAGRGLRDDLGPALAKVIRADLTPALRDTSTDLLPVVYLMSHEMSRGLVIGAAEAMRELDVRRKLGEYEGGFWSRLDLVMHKGINFAQILAWVLGFLVLLFGALFARAILLRRRIEAERARSERMLLGLMQGLQQGSDKPEVEHLLATLRERHPELSDEDYFKELNRRASIRQSSFGRPRRRL
jgi:hypothetical protein